MKSKLDSDFETKSGPKFVFVPLKLKLNQLMLYLPIRDILFGNIHGIPLLAPWMMLFTPRSRVRGLGRTFVEQVTRRFRTQNRSYSPMHKHQKQTCNPPTPWANASSSVDLRLAQGTSRKGLLYCFTLMHNWKSSSWWMLWTTALNAELSKQRH